METLLILISLVLHVIAFLIIRSQQVKMQAILDKEEKLNRQTNEMEELLSSYMFEMKEENEHLIARLGDMDTSKKDRTVYKDESVAGQPSKMKDDGLPDLYIKENPESPTNTVSEYIPATEIQEQDSVEKSVSFQAFTLFNQGESVETIARKLNCGKTEIELMLKFYRNY